MTLQDSTNDRQQPRLSSIAAVFKYNLELLLICGAVLAVPFIHSAGQQGIRLTQMLAFIGVGGLLWSVVLARQVSLSISYLYIIALGSSLSSGFGNVHATALVFVTAATFIVYCAAKLEILHCRYFLHALVLAGLLQSLYGYVQVAGFDPLFERVQLSDSWIPVGTLGQQTVYGPFLVTSFAAAIFTTPWLAIVILPAIMSTLSAMTYVSLLCVLLFFLWNKYGVKIATLGLILVFVIGLITFAVIQDGSLLDPQGRIGIWKRCIMLWWKNPIFGWGLGSYKVIAPLQEPAVITRTHGYFLQAHNDYLQVLFETGLFGLAGVAWMLFDFFRAAIRQLGSCEGAALTTIFLAIAVNALGSFPFHTAPLALVALIAWAFVVGRRKGAA